MPSGDMRRPPLLWEQRLARRVSALGPGVTTSSSSNVVEDFGTSTGYDEPSDTITTLGTPSTPTISGTLKGIVVEWDGTDTDGDLYNAENQWVEVHTSDSSGFTPSGSTKRGVLYESGGFVVTPLVAGTTYYARFVGYDSQGNSSEPSAQASGTPGLVISSDIGSGAVTADAVSFNAREVGGITQTVSGTQPSGSIVGDTWINTSNGSYNYYNGSSWQVQSWGSASISAGAITTLQLAAGAVIAENIGAGAITAGKIAAGAVTTDKLTAGAISGFTISGSVITGGTITGATVQTRASGLRVLMNDLDAIQWFNGASLYGSLRASSFTNPAGSSVNGVLLEDGGGLIIEGSLVVDQIRVEGAASDFPGCVSNAGATTGDAGFNGNRLRQKSSTQRLKFDIAELSGTLTGVDADRRTDVATVDPLGILDVGVVEFTWVEDGEASDWRELGFIAEDVASKLPIAVGRDADGQPFNVRDTPMIAALVAVAQQQQATINDLTTRIESLEAAR